MQDHKRNLQVEWKGRELKEITKKKKKNEQMTMFITTDLGMP